MAQPKSVKKQAKEAEKLQQALNTDPEAKVTDPDPEKTEKLEQPAAEVAAKEQPNLDNEDLPSSGEEPKKDQKPDWEAKYKGLQTRYNREVPELRGQLKTANQRIDDFTKEIDDLKELLQAAPAAPEPREVIFTDEEREQYGDGWIDMMTKIAESSHSDLVKQVGDLQQKLANVDKSVTEVRETAVVNDERSFFTALARKVKAKTGRSWKEINDEDDFHNFLAEEVPYTGREKQEYLAEAREKLDVDTAAQFFIDYAGPSSSKDEPSPDLEPKVPEELITPETGGGGIPPIPEERVYTTYEIDQFYADKRTGKYKGKKDEARKIEQDILAAGREGRIVSKRAPAYA